VLLLDEPLSNLDARLRVEMRGEIRQLQQKLGITAVYVTHDQEEALAISDRVAVMRSGRVEQVAGPEEIYRRPQTPFVAAFVGTTNLFTGRVVRGGDFLEVDVGGTVFFTPSPPRGEGWGEGRSQATGGGPLPPAAGAAGPSLSPGGRGITFSLRPEALRVVPPGALPPDGWACVEAKLARVEFLGAMTRAELLLAGGEVLRLATTELPPGLGDTVTLAYDPAQVTVFEAA
jgi:ABC-type Fe3+/spermidine/putrescine transport system ATPase subunit